MGGSKPLVMQFYVLLTLLPCIPDSHPYRLSSTKCCIDTVISSDDGHIVA